MIERFHGGERAAQARVGVRARMSEIGARVIRDAMPDQHREFFTRLPFIVVGGTDAGGRPWASAMAGPEGFVQAPSATRLTIGGARDPDDPVLGAPARPGVAIGVLGIEPHTRRRNRANGSIDAVGPATVEIAVRESFGNCPKYIHPRRARFDPRSRPGAIERAAGLDDRATAAIGAADTLFLATAHPDVGVDVSHRGGPAGFVHVEGDTLWMPDFSGNNFFNSVGNLLVDPRAGLLFIDYDRGDLLHVTADAAIVWEGPALAAFAGAERLLRFAVRAVIRRAGALAIRWS